MKANSLVVLGSLAPASLDALCFPTSCAPLTIIRMRGTLGWCAELCACKLRRPCFPTRHPSTHQVILSIVANFFDVAVQLALARCLPLGGCAARPTRVLRLRNHPEVAAFRFPAGLAARRDDLGAVVHGDVFHPSPSPVGNYSRLHVAPDGARLLGYTITKSVSRTTPS